MSDDQKIDKTEPNLDGLLDQLDRIEKNFRSQFKDLFEKNDTIYRADFYVFGAVRRMMALTKGFRQMIQERNFLCAAPLVRMQLDNALRIFALSLIRDREGLAQKLISGEPLSTQKDEDGQKMRDAYLVKKLSEPYPWVEKLYAETSGFIHLSERHFFNSIQKTNEANHTVYFSLSAEDGMRHETEYFDVVQAFRDALKLTATVMLGYAAARAQS